MEPHPYCGPPPRPSDWIWAWNLDPYLIAGLAVLSALGAVWLRHQQRLNDQAGGSRTFGVAVAAAVLAFLSPLCALTVALFAARTLHHLVIIGLLAPALALALPLLRVRVAPSFLALSAALWLWHVPQVYSAAWDHAQVYWALQAALILPAWGFWSAVLHRRDLTHVIWLIPLVGQMGVLGALLTFAPQAFYLEHLALSERFGMSALEDQQLAGLIMWVPGMLPIAVLGGIMGWRLFRAEFRV